jgi:hypothetical protein
MQSLGSCVNVVYQILRQADIDAHRLTAVLGTTSGASIAARKVITQHRLILITLRER